MKVWLTLFFLNAIVLSLDTSASEVYQCKNSEGKVAYSDKKCADDEAQEKLIYKDFPWAKMLDANKPPGTKIIEIKKKRKDTIIRYACYTQIELDTFMKSAHRLSGLNVNLLKYKTSKNGGRGEALIQITPKSNPIFKDKKPF